jgi:hypothetical protein
MGGLPLDRDPRIRLLKHALSKNTERHTNPGGFKTGQGGCRHRTRWLTRYSIASNHLGTLLLVLGWASSLGDVVFAFRYKSAYVDIKRREQELEERERKLRDAEMRQAYQQQKQGQRARAGWQQEAKGFRQKTDGKRSGEKSGNKQGGTSKNYGQKRRTANSYAPPPQSGVRARHFKALGLKPGRNYSLDEIKKAYRCKVMKVHPDAGGSQV